MCREMHKYGMEVLYEKVRWVIEVGRYANSWVEVPPSSRTFLLQHIVDLIFVVDVPHDCEAWLKRRLEYNRNATFLEDMSSLKRLRLNMVLRSYPRILGKPLRTREDVNGASAVIFWLLRSVHKDIQVDYEDWGFSAWTRVDSRTLSSFGAEWNPFRPGHDSCPALPTDEHTSPALISKLLAELDARRR